MGIENYTGDLAAIDNTFGYNDKLIVATNNPSLPINIIDKDLNRYTSGTNNPSAGVSEADAFSVVTEGDRLLRLPNGALIHRRSRFADSCAEGGSLPNNSLTLTEPMARALAFFGAAYQGSDPTGDRWCRLTVPGTAGLIQTPWDVSGKADLQRIQAVLGRIRSARAGDFPSDLQPAQHALAKELAAAVTDKELKAVSGDIAKRLDSLASLGDLYLEHPVLHTLGIAVLFGLGTDIYHLARYALVGGEAPWKSNGKGIFTRLIKGIRDYFKKDPPSGGGTGGGGGKELPSIAIADLPAGAQISGGYVVKDGQPIGVAVLKKEITSESVPEGQVVSGEINTHGDDLTVLTPVPDFGINWDEEPTRVWEALPDGVVPLDEGAFIYRYQATINGEVVGLSENVARQLAAARGLSFDANSFFSAGDFQYGEFMKLASPAPATIEPSPQDVVRSLGVKGPQAIAPRSVARLSSKQEAANSAADKMTTGTGPRVTGFGASGVGVGAPAPVVRVVPVLVP